MADLYGTGQSRADYARTHPNAKAKPENSGNRVVTPRKYPASSAPNAGGFKGVARPGEAVQVMENGQKKYISGSMITDAEGPGDVKRPPSYVVNPSRGMARPSRESDNLTRSDLFKGANSEGSILNKNEKKPIVQMRQGMSPSSQGYNRSNETPIGDASKQLRGYGYDLIRKGKSFESARKLMQGTDQFRGLSQSAKDYILNEFDAWWNNQTAGGKPKREVEMIRRGGQPSMSQAPNRKPDTATANLARVANSIDNVGY